MIPRSRYIIWIVSGFSLGIFLSYFGRHDLITEGWLLGLIIGYILLFWESFILRWCGLISLAIVIGYIYPNLLKQDQLIIVPSSAQKLVELLGMARMQFISALQRVLSEPQASFAAGLVVGVKDGFPLDLKQIFINTGVIHLVAVSGYNITIVSKLFSVWLRPLGRYAAFFVGTLAILAFIIFAGGQASVVRAGIMGWLFILARFSFRLPHIKNALFLTAFIMIILQPSVILKDIGFQLSFLSMMGMVYLSSPVGSGLSRLKFNRWLPESIVLALRETLAAQLAVAPLIAGHFGRLSLIAPLPNMIIVPIVALPMLLAAGIGFMALISSAKAIALLAIPLHYILSAILSVIYFCNRVPYASVIFAKFPWYWVTLCYLSLVILLMYYYRCKEQKKI